MLEYAFALVAAVVEFLLAAEHALAACAPFAEQSGDFALPRLATHLVELRRHEVVVGGGDLIDHHRCDDGPLQQFLRIEEVDQSDAGHEGGSVGDGETLTHMYA